MKTACCCYVHSVCVKPAAIATYIFISLQLPWLLTVMLSASIINHISMTATACVYARVSLYQCHICLHVFLVVCSLRWRVSAQFHRVCLQWLTSSVSQLALLIAAVSLFNCFHVDIFTANKLWWWWWLVGWLVGLGLFSITVPGIETGHYGDDATSWLATASQRRPRPVNADRRASRCCPTQWHFLVTYHWSYLVIAVACQQ